MSSRNAYLDADQRRAAPAIYRALLEAKRRFAGGEDSPSQLEEAATAVLEQTPEMTIQYLSVVEEDTLRRPDQVRPGNVLAVAVKLGLTRLIDNVVFGAERV
jgi:pantoate--beta-alanine ligase